MKRDIKGMVEGIAAQTVADEGAALGLELGAGADLATESLLAPEIGEWAFLREAPLVPDTLDLKEPGSDETIYTPEVDYFEDASAGSFQNVAIPPGTALTAVYQHEELFSEKWRPLALGSGWMDAVAGNGAPAVYREGTRAYLRGVVTGGATAAGDVVFSVPPSYSPEHVVALRTLSDAGPALLNLFPDGSCEIGESFPVGNGFLILDGLSWPYDESLAPLTWQSEITWQTERTWED